MTAVSGHGKGSLTVVCNPRVSMQTADDLSSFFRTTLRDVDATVDRRACEMKRLTRRAKARTAREGSVGSFPRMFDVQHAPHTMVGDGPSDFWGDEQKQEGWPTHLRP